jgi:hypothetical protein
VAQTFTDPFLVVPTGPEPLHRFHVEGQIGFELLWYRLPDKYRE